MSAAKRFWTDVALAEVANGFAVTLDGRAIKTPAKQELAIPTAALAEAVADEWRSQGETYDPKSMPQTCYCNSVIDGVARNRAAVVETVAAYGGSDLLCYRAENPDGLIARQASRWDPLLDWARDRHDAPLVQVQGVIHADQPTPSLQKLAAAVDAHSDFELAGLHDLVAISGSLVIGLAISEGYIAPEDGFAISRLDEDWQMELWGDDDEAAVVAAKKPASLLKRRDLSRSLGKQRHGNRHAIQI